MKIPDMMAVLAMAVGLITEGCTSLAGTSWTLVDMNGRSVESGTHIALTFNANVMKP